MAPPYEVTGPNKAGAASGPRTQEARASTFLPCTFSLLSGHSIASPQAAASDSSPQLGGSSTEQGSTELGSTRAPLSFERTKDLLRAEILHNIVLILNSHSHPRLSDLHGDRELSYSVLGMGLDDFCGHSHAAQSLAQLQQRIREQIVYFEPRLDPDSVQVHLFEDGTYDGLNHTINLEIVARIHPRLLADQVFRCTTLLDLESGANVVRLSSGRGQD